MRNCQVICVFVTILFTLIHQNQGSFGNNDVRAGGQSFSNNLASNGHSDVRSRKMIDVPPSVPECNPGERRDHRGRCRGVVT